MNENMLIEITDTFTIYGTGDTKKEVIENGFKKLQSDVFKRIDHPIIHMIPKAVYLKEEHTEEKEEAFLYFFMKRKKKTYEITMDIEVVIKYIDI